MRLHLIRHAHAVPAEEDPVRPLSARGRRQAKALAAFFRANGWLQPKVMWHSPLARSHETAALLAAGLGFTGPLHEESGLEPEDDPRGTFARLRKAGDGLVIVGHEPHLGLLATLLVGRRRGWTEAKRTRGQPVVTGGAEASWFVLKKAACLTLERSENDHTWSVRALIGPSLIGFKK
ncbi:MAG TPA: histidine phosphatase family protein [Opitutus sp.]|nr:histidine phosphatase family protein [Opitutus sp.]